MTAGITVADLARRVQRLEDREAIGELFVRYKAALDGKDFVAYADLFTEDGEFLAGTTRVRGRSEIRSLVEGMVGSLLGQERGQDFHVVANVTIDLDGDRATARSTWLYVVRDEADQPRLAKLGHYEDDVVRDGDGQWRFQRRRAPTDIPAS